MAKIRRVLFSFFLGGQRAEKDALDAKYNNNNRLSSDPLQRSVAQSSVVGENTMDRFNFNRLKIKEIFLRIPFDIVRLTKLVHQNLLPSLSEAAFETCLNQMMLSLETFRKVIDFSFNDSHSEVSCFQPMFECLLIVFLKKLSIASGVFSKRDLLVSPANLLELTFSATMSDDTEVTITGFSDLVIHTSTEETQLAPELVEMYVELKVPATFAGNHNFRQQKHETFAQMKGHEECTQSSAHACLVSLFFLS